MSPIYLLLNLLWIVFGGLWMAAGWMVAAVVWLLPLKLPKKEPDKLIYSRGQQGVVSRRDVRTDTF